MLDFLKKKLMPGDGPSNADRLALNNFTHNFYLGEYLSPRESQWRVESGVVELLVHGLHRANGLLVTASGYILTAHHCVEQMNKLRVRTGTGDDLPLAKICCFDDSSDLALIKADMPAEPEVMLYKFFPRHQFSALSYRNPVVLLTRWDGEIKRRGGFTNGRFDNSVRFDEDSVRSNLAFCSMAAQRGDSGGAAVTPEGAIVGILSGGDRTKISVIASWYEALTMISKYAHSS